MSKEMIPFNDVKELAKSLAASKFFPGVQSAEQALVLMMVAQSEGMAPIQAMQRYDVISGRPAKKAQAMLADFLSAGGRVQWHEHNDKACEATFTHPTGGEIRVRWDLDKAKKAGLLGKDNWQKHTEAMLHARCVSNGVRFVYPQATGGMYDPTEVQDFATEPKQWPAQSVETPAAEQISIDAETITEPDPNAHPATVQASDGPVKLEMPGNDCDRIPKDVRRLKRSLPDTPFAEMDDQTLKACISVLKDLAKRAKDGDNRSALTVVTAFAEAEQGKRVPQ